MQVVIAGFWGFVAHLDKCASILAVVALVFHVSANYYRAKRERKLCNCRDRIKQKVKKENENES